MAVFITGGHGHIASWTAYFLAKEGEQVILYDTEPAAPDHLTEVSKNITFQKLDLTSIEDAARGTSMLYQAKAVKHNIYNIATGVATSVGTFLYLGYRVN